MSKINGLSDAEEEMLQILEEECGELIQSASKVKRFGMKKINRHNMLNSESLLEEASDVLACLSILEKNGLLDRKRMEEIASHKLKLLMDPTQKRVHYITPEMIP